MGPANRATQVKKSWLKQPLVLAAIAVIVLIVLRLLPVVAQALLVIFGAVVMAVLVDGVSNWLSRYTPLPRWLALTLFLLICLAGVGATFWLMGQGISEQIDEMRERVKQGREQLNQLQLRHDWARQLWSGEGTGGGILSSEMWGRMGGVFTTAFGAVANGLILLVVAVYLAITPDVYFRNALRLAPPARRPRYAEVAEATGSALRWWFVGRFSSMAVIGVLTGLGLWIARVPMALALGLITGLLSFVPFAGPILAAVPGILVGWGQGPKTALYALLVYVVVQALEGNLITPLIQKRAVSVPPALLVSGQLVLGSLFGFWGVLWATPLIVTAIVVIQKLYIEDVLQDGGATAPKMEQAAMTTD